MEKNKNKRLGYKTVLMSIAGNFILFALKFFAGISSGSVAMIADAWHTLSDSLTSVIVLVGIKVSYKPADEKHPFGHGRSDLIASVVVAIFLGVAGAGFVKMAVKNFLHTQTPQFGWFAIGVFVLSLLTKEAMARYSIYMGNKTGSNALKADGWHHRSDALSTVVVLVSVGLGRFLWWIDSVAAIVVAGFLLHAAYKILKKSGSSIIGEDVDPKLYKKIEGFVCEISKEVSDIHHFHAHDYGNHTEVTFHIRLPKEKKLVDANAITTEIKYKLREKMDIEATIYLDVAEE